MKRITIDPVTRIEGHAKITIHLDDNGKVAGTEFHVTQIRGFEKFTEGRPYYEMPGITARICGICPISHLLASSKACDSIMAVRIHPAAAQLRELIHCAQIRAVARAQLFLSLVARYSFGNGFGYRHAQRAGSNCGASGTRPRWH